MRIVQIWSVCISHWGMAKTKIKVCGNCEVYEVDGWNKSGK